MPPRSIKRVIGDRFEANGLGRIADIYENVRIRTVKHCFHEELGMTVSESATLRTAGAFPKSSYDIALNPPSRFPIVDGKTGF
jgi:hypothetical protein